MDSCTIEYWEDFFDAEHEYFWREKGATIEVIDTGHLLNGQHRLTAIVQCGKSIRIRIKENMKMMEAAVV